MALHEQAVGKTDEWYTPAHVFDAMAVRFDQDVSSPGQYRTPWIPAEDFICFKSLERGWRGFVWMNPPFGGRNGIAPWLEKFFAHGNGVALVPDRTSAPWWQQYAHLARAVLFVSPKLKFIGEDGNPGRSPAQGTALFAAGLRGTEALQNAARNGLGLLFTPAWKGPPPSDGTGHGTVSTLRTADDASGTNPSNVEKQA